jgi:hypothetical protein
MVCRGGQAIRVGEPTDDSKGADNGAAAQRHHEREDLREGQNIFSPLE